MILSAPLVWASIAGLALVVFATRIVFLVLPARFHPRGMVERALRMAPLAALAALALPPTAGALLVEGATVASVWQDGRLPAALTALIVARLARNPFFGLLAGVAMLWFSGLSA
jgi:branched-subunit amino acid transport protein